MQQIGFSLMAAMCTQGNSVWLTTKISCIFRTEQLQIFSATGPNTVFLCYPVCKLNGCGEKIFALGLWGWSVWTQADICRSGALPR